MTSIYLANVIGWYLVIMSVFLVVRHKQLQTLVKDVLSKPGLFFLVAVITLILGLLMVTSHNVWVIGWPVVITILSWLVLISGLVRLFFVDQLKTIAKKFIQSKRAIWIAAAINFLVGAYLLYIVCTVSMS